MMHIRVAEIGTVMTSVVFPSVCVVVGVVSKSIGCSAIIKMGESLVFIQECSKDSSWASATAPASTSCSASSTYSSFITSSSASSFGRVRVVVLGGSGLTDC